MTHHTSALWSIDLPNGWTIEDTPPIAYFYHPAQQCGTLQLISLWKHSGDVTGNERHDDALREASVHDAIANPVDYGPFKGWYAHYSEGAVTWRLWWLAFGPIRVDARYDCDGVHTTTRPACAAVEDLLRSLRPFLEPHCQTRRGL